jgi:hypothetical protein
VDDQRVPDLEELDEQQVRHFLAKLFSDLSAEAEYEMRHQDYAMEMPQSGERIRGREKTIPSALHSLTLFLCTVRSDSVIMCT